MRAPSVGLCRLGGRWRVISRAAVGGSVVARRVWFAGFATFLVLAIFGFWFLVLGGRLVRCGACVPLRVAGCTCFGPVPWCGGVPWSLVVAFRRGRVAAVLARCVCVWWRRSWPSVVPRGWPLMGALLLSFPCAFPHPLAVTFPFSSPLPSAVVVGWCLGQGSAGGPCLGVGGLEPPAEGLRGVGGMEDLDHVPEEGLPLGPGHGSLGGVVVGAVGCASEEFLESVGAVLSSPPARPARPTHPATKLAHDGGGDHQVCSAGGKGVGGRGRTLGSWSGSGGVWGGGGRVGAVVRGSGGGGGADRRGRGRSPRTRGSHCALLGRRTRGGAPGSGSGGCGGVARGDRGCVGALFSGCLRAAGRATRGAAAVPKRQHAVPLGRGGKFRRSLWFYCVAGLRRVGRVRWWGQQVACVQRGFRGLPRVWVALEEGPAVPGVGVLVVRVCLLGNAHGEVLLMVGSEGPMVRRDGAGLVGRGWWRCVVGGLGQRLLRPSGVVVVQVHGGLEVGGVGLVCLGMMGVTMVVGVAVVVVMVGVVVVIWVCTKDPLGLWWHTGWVHVHHVQPPGLRGREDG